MVDTFSKAMRLMRKHDPQSQENGFGMLDPIAAEVLPQLIADFEAESDHVALNALICSHGQVNGTADERAHGCRDAYF